MNPDEGIFNKVIDILTWPFTLINKIVGWFR